MSKIPARKKFEKLNNRQIIVADSGSTKTDWAILSSSGSVIRIQTQGLNPYFTSVDEFTAVLIEKVLPQVKNDLPFEVCFYGAGCGNPDYCDFFKSVFLSLNAEKVSIETDLLAVAHAALGRNEGIAGILGTGTNAGYFSGGTLVKAAPSTGYVLGDEGSATWIGKQLLTAWIRKELPEDIYQFMTTELHLESKEVLRNVYSVERPNRYIAAFAANLKDFPDHPWVLEMLQNGFTAFFKHYINILGTPAKCPVMLAGTVANIHAGLLHKVSINEGYAQFKVLPSVIDGLIRFHQTY